MKTQQGDSIAEAWLTAALGVDAIFPWRMLRQDRRDGYLARGARACGAALPRRVAYVVDRRAVVDQATHVAMGLRRLIEDTSALKRRLGIPAENHSPISTLPGQFTDYRQSGVARRSRASRRKATQLALIPWTVSRCHE